MQNQSYLKISLAGLLILLLFTTATASADDAAVTAPSTPYQTLGTTPPTRIPDTVRGKGVPLHPVISVVALCCTGFLIHLHKRK
jgi:hypothetical protein